MAVLAILGEEGFIPPQIQEISFPDGELPNYPRALTVNTRCIHKICMTNCCLSSTRDGGLVPSGGSSRLFFVHFPASTLTIR